ncbi:IucA/IucC family protein [Macrococcus brunensis]|uniref:IucA/IucC family protein n=1 Tax=Macrococcus brunensis TaxID=198483 RepID=UPI001EEFA0A4|nr:IucA/IucC family protein [Macrococcus brunensis]ULG74502.1 IucA/IucC family protein [Macrococcus brunensis]
MNHKQLIHFATIHFPDLSLEDIEESLERADFRTKKMLNHACTNEAIDLTQVEPEALKRLEEEMADSTANLTLSYLQYKRDYARFGKTYKSIGEYYAAEGKDASLFEQCCYEGHPFHPMSKTKMGFTPDKVMKFAPEFKQPVDVMEIHVHSSLVGEKGEATHGEQSDYRVIYVHEWQWAHVIMAKYHDLIDEGLIKLGAKVTAAPLLSFRSLLAPEAVIKTAVSVQATSAVRNVSRASIENGITLSRYVDVYYRQHHYTGCYIQKDIYGS